MYTVDFSLDKSCKGEVVKSVGEVVPDTVIAVFLANFIIETIDC